MILQETAAPAATSSIIWQIVAISLAMVALSQFFQWKFSMSREKQMEFQQKVQSLQEELKLAQAQGDYGKMEQLREQMMDFSRDMMKNQFLPMCIRTIIFFVIFGILNSIYGKYDYSGILGGLNWFWLYFLISLGTNLLISGIKKAIKKRKGEEEQQPIMDNIRALQRNLSVNQRAMGGMGGSGIGVGMGPGSPSTRRQQKPKKKTAKPWKKKLLADDMEDYEDVEDIEEEP